MSRYTKSIVAAGHQEVCNAAGIVLSEGGNAFDAVVAAGFASAVVEPALTSLGGGGFMLGYGADRNREIFCDFFVDTPGRGRELDEDPHFFPVTVNFSGTSQIFNIGLGSAAVPGTLKGLLHIHRTLGRVPLAEVIEPARKLALGHVLNSRQAHFLELLKPIMTFSATGRSLYERDGLPLGEGAVLANSETASFLEQVACEGDESFYRGEIGAAVAADMAENGGLLTREDLAAYEVRERRPIRIPYRGKTFLTAPEPSMGGTLIGLSLSLLGSSERKNGEWGSAAFLGSTVRLMQEVEHLRSCGVTTPAALAAFLADGEAVDASGARVRLFSRGTTHISVADSNGNCASMTCSNGEGSGYFAPRTGVMLNNMMGEDDLHPEGFHASPPGQRVASMMSPSMLLGGAEAELVIGSGGSKRIRTAISQVLSQVVDYGRDLKSAVDSPRLYWDEDRVQIEPGFAPEAVAALAEQETVVLWRKKDVYFGGVHAVIPGCQGAGDPRRGGAVVEIPAE